MVGYQTFNLTTGDRYPLPVLDSGEVLMRKDDWVTIGLCIVGIICVAVFLAWLGEPRYVEFDGMTCVESGIGSGRTLDCDWESKEKRDEKE